jgi:hypothetical protein
MGDESYVVAQSALWCVYGVVQSAVLLVFMQRFYGHDMRESAETTPAVVKRKDTFIGLIVALSVTAGGMTWMFQFALAAGDRLGACIVAAVIVVLPLIVTQIGRVAKKRWGRWSVAAGQLCLSVQISGTAGVILFMLHWRVHEWIATIRGVSLTDAQQQIPLWSADLAATVLILWTVALFLLARRREAAQSP